MNKNWDEIFKKYVYKINSSDERDTFGSSPELVRKIIDFSPFEPSYKVIDMARDGETSQSNYRKKC